MDTGDWKKYAELLKYSRSLGIPGPGEPLLNPKFEELLTNVKQFLDPRCNTYIITNGVIIDKKLNFLRDSIINTYNISLNAATSSTHSKIMNLPQESFEKTIQNINSLVKMKLHGRKDITINITFVVINQNLHEMAEFVKLGNKLRVIISS